MGFLTPEEKAIVEKARRRQLIRDRSPGYLCPNQCTAMSLVLAIPTLGFSLLFVPIFWVAQYEHTSGRIAALKRQLESLSDQDAMLPAGELT